jgi:hypothetical protein
MAKRTKRGVLLTRNSETMTESQFFSMFRQALRRLTLRWRPRTDYLNALRRPNQSDNKRIKFEYPCEKCRNWFKRADIELDHITECGSIRTFADIGIWCSRAFIEKDGGWMLLCKTCHLAKTHNYKED